VHLHEKSAFDLRRVADRSTGPIPQLNISQDRSICTLMVRPLGFTCDESVVKDAPSRMLCHCPPSENLLHARAHEKDVALSKVRLDVQAFVRTQTIGVHR
jgi:hypothetical protein